MSISNLLKKLNRRDSQIIPNLPKLNKIKFASILIAFFFLTVISHQILAETLTVDQSAVVQKFKDKQAAIGQGNNQESWLNEAMMSNAMSLNQAIAGTIPDSVLAGDTTNWNPGGIIGFTNNAIASLYTPPASGVQYIAQTFNHFLGKPVYAISGYEGLQGIMPLWKSFRNAVYVLFSLIFIGIGIAIMLRVKISQQAVITIQSAVPQLITSLILVTFSYAIAGLLIDLSYLFSGLILAILFNSKNGINSDLFPGTFSISPSFTNLLNGGFWVTCELLFKLLPIGLILGISAIIGAIVGLIFTGFSPAGLLGAPIGAIILFLVIILTILVQTIKYFIGIAKCYIAILIRIIFAPIEIGMGAIPNSKMNFSSWIWNIVANLAVFPCSIIFLVIMNLIIEAIDAGSLWNPPMMGINKILTAAIGISSFFILAKLPSIIPEFVFSIKPSPLGKAIGEGLAGSLPGKVWSTYKSGQDRYTAETISQGISDTKAKAKSGLVAARERFKSRGMGENL